MSIRKLDFVVLSSQIACCSDEINVMIGIVILLEINRLQLEASQRLRSWKLVSNLLKLVVVIESASISIWILILLVIFLVLVKNRLTGSLSSA